MKDYIDATRQRVIWGSKQGDETTPIHIALHFASDENRDFLIRSYFQFFPELLSEVNSPRDVLRHVAIWAITNENTTDLSSVRKTVDLLRECEVKMIQMKPETECIINRVIDRGCHGENGILANIKQKHYTNAKTVTIVNHHLEGENTQREVDNPEDEIKFMISRVAPPVQNNIRQKPIKSLGTKLHTMIATNTAEFEFAENDEIKTALKERIKEIPTAVKNPHVFCYTKTWKFPVDALELAILTSSETIKVPGTNEVYKEHYVSQILDQNVHTTMDKKSRGKNGINLNITAIHIAMLAVADASLLLTIVKKIYQKQPWQIKTLTRWNESVLHYLLGGGSLCLRPLEILKYCREKDVKLNVIAATDISADHISHYKLSNWFSNDQKDDVIMFLKKWRQEDYPGTDPVCRSGPAASYPV